MVPLCKSAEVLKVGETTIPCYVVRTVREMSFREGANSYHENTYWIEKASGLVRKAALVALKSSGSRDPCSPQKLPGAPSLAFFAQGGIPQPSTSWALVFHTPHRSSTLV
jgi:hypothetical protein